MAATTAARKIYNLEPSQKQKPAHYAPASFYFFCCPYRARSSSVRSFLSVTVVITISVPPNRDLVMRSPCSSIYDQVSPWSYSSSGAKNQANTQDTTNVADIIKTKVLNVIFLPLLGQMFRQENVPTIPYYSNLHLQLQAF